MRGHAEGLADRAIRRNPGRAQPTPKSAAELASTTRFAAEPCAGVTAHKGGTGTIVASTHSQTPSRDGTA
ncbi:hypothetical protein A33M_3281 [Rhodovulum sp. PH10]|nr:hypothetical protein A33M_3281 [Rhodovulum sp. PH10]